MLNKTIDIKTSPRIGGKEYSGICVVHNEQILMLLNFNEITALYDGFTIFRNDDIELYREWDSEDFTEREMDNSRVILNEIDLSVFKNFECSLEQLSSKLIAVFTEDELDSYYVGKIISIKDNILSLQLISKESEWINMIELDIDTIWYIGFDSSYETELMKDAL